MLRRIGFSFPLSYCSALPPLSKECINSSTQVANLPLLVILGGSPVASLILSTISRRSSCKYEVSWDQRRWNVRTNSHSTQIQFWKALYQWVSEIVNALLCHWLNDKETRSITCRAWFVVLSPCWVFGDLSWLDLSLMYGKSLSSSHTVPNTLYVCYIVQMIGYLDSQVASFLRYRTDCDTIALRSLLEFADGHDIEWGRRVIVLLSCEGVAKSVMLFVLKNRSLEG